MSCFDISFSISFCMARSFYHYDRTTRYLLRVPIYLCIPLSPLFLSSQLFFISPSILLHSFCLSFKLEPSLEIILRKSVNLLLWLTLFRQWRPFYWDIVFYKVNFRPFRHRDSKSWHSNRWANCIPSKILHYHLLGIKMNHFSKSCPKCLQIFGLLLYENMPPRPSK